MSITNGVPRAGEQVMRYDDPALDGKALPAGPPPIIDCSIQHYRLTLDRTRTNQHGWTLGAMIRGTLGARADGLTDLEAGRAIAKEVVPHIDVSQKSEAYVERLVILRHDEWQPPAGLTVRHLLQDADAPLRLDSVGCR